MPILVGDVKLVASQVMDDVAEGGGAPTSTVIVDGASNSLFNDISEMDRAGGRVNLRKVFASIQTNTTDTYLGGNVIVAEAPSDPRVAVTIFSTDEVFDRRTNARDRIEAYLNKGSLWNGYLLENHITGQRSVQLFQRVGAELPAIGKNLPISEYQQLRTRNASDADLRNQILRDTRDAVQSVADRIERLRGTVLVTGRATIDQANFKSDDDFARSPSHTVTAGTLWSTASADALGYLATLIDLYVSDNGEQPGAILTSQRVVRAMGALNQMQTALVGGGVRPATVTDVQNTVTANGLPALHIYDRKTSGGRVIPDDRIILLPEPSDPNGTSELGATFWGQTLTSIDPAFSLQPSEQPGVVVGVYRNEKPPMIAEVLSLIHI